MRQPTLILLAAALIAAPAAAQGTENVTAPSGYAGPDANMAMNATDAATVNGVGGDPAMQAAPAVPVTSEAPGVTDATVTPDTGERGGGFPWGLLGLIGLVGLVGRFRS